MIRHTVFMALFFSIVFSQPNNTKEEDSSSEQKKNKTMDEVLKNKKKIEGFFTIYQDTTNGSLFMLVDSKQLDKEFIHFVHGVNGQNNAGITKGWPYYSKIFKLKKYFGRIEFEVQNSSFYFDPANPLSRSAESNITTAILASSKILSEEGGKALIGIDNIFLTEALHQITRGVPPGSSNKNPFRIGRLAKERTKYLSINNYPENTDIVVQYVYTNPSPTNKGSGRGITDPRSVNVSLQHSLIEVPENDFIPRFEDPRVGYFTNSVTDMTSPNDATPYRDVIHRWNLEKKNPDQARSEAKDPIVWWIENTTPHEFRKAIEEGVLAWNKAFEKAGLINALEVKVQPDDATWDAGDIRYNVIRWTSSPNPWFGGLGPRFTNPRTGQILGADIMLEYVYFTNRVKYEKLYQTFSGSNENDSTMLCNVGAITQQGNMFGILTMGGIGDFSQLEQHKIIYESLVKLVLHEVGHCLGLTHNFFGSQLHSFNNIHDRHITEPIGLTSSVMDYVSANIGPGPNFHGQFYTTTPGPYDIWAIEFGYTPSLKNPEDEKERVENLLKKSTSNEFGFGHEPDNMNVAGRGMDPRIMVSDLSGDPVSYAQQRMDIIKSLYPDLLKRLEKPGESYHAFTDAFSILNREYSNCARVISRYIGGVYMDRSMVGQGEKKEPLTPINKDKQKWAMTLLNSYAFSPNAFDIPEEVYRHLQLQRRGTRGTGDPKVLDIILNIQKGILSHLLHPNVLKRISNTALYGNLYGINEMMNDLTTACFSADAGSNVNSARMNLQAEYTTRLIRIINNKGKISYGHIAISTAFENLNKIKKYASVFSGVNGPTKAHRRHLVFLIDKALDT